MQQLATAATASFGVDRRFERAFFAAMAIALALTTFLGFAPSYYLRQPGAKTLTTLMHLHGAVATAWMLVYVTQTALVSAGRIDLHRRLGQAAMFLAAIFIVITAMTAFASPPRIRVFQVGAISLFTVFVVGGWLRRRDRDAHKRFMLLATIAMIPPALARLQLPFPGVVGANVGGLMFLIPLVAYDLATRRRLHPVLLWGGLLLVVMLPVRMALMKLLS